jgi:hypothetical protein
MILLIDGNNYVRRLIETDTTGQTPRTIFFAMMNPEHRTFFAWDAEDGNTARRNIFPGYKSKRPPLTEDMYVGFDLVAEALKFSQAIQIKLKGYEADDIIATLARHYASQGEKVHINSTDRDFLQLVIEYPGLITTECGLKNGVQFEDVRLHKTLIGDTSDSIPGIPGFGQGAWDKIDDKTGIRLWFHNIELGIEPGEFVWGNKSANAWANDPANQAVLKTYWDIIGFIQIPHEVIAEHLVIGNGDYNAGDRFLLERLQ